MQSGDDQADVVATSPSPAEAGPKRLAGWPLLLAALGVVLLVQGLFVTSYIGALHAPKPHRVPIGVVGDARLVAAVGTRVSLKPVTFSNEALARRAIDRRQIDAAFIAAPGGSTLVVVPAAGAAIAAAFGTAFGAAAAAGGQKLAVVQVHPLSSGDSAGIAPFFVTMALVVGGYLSATMAMAFGGPVGQRRRGLVLAGVAVVGALFVDTIAGPILGALPTSKFFVLWALFTLIMAAVALAAAALQALLGAAGTLVVVVVFVIFGAPAAGGAVPSSFLPGFWRTFGPYLPAGAGTTSVRNTIYFDGNAITRSLIVLGAYLVVGALVLMTVRGRQRRETGAEHEAEVEASAAVGVVV